MTQTYLLFESWWHLAQNKRNKNGRKKAKREISWMDAS